MLNNLKLAENISKLYEHWAKYARTDETRTRFNVQVPKVEIPDSEGISRSASLTIDDEGDFWAVTVETFNNIKLNRNRAATIMGAVSMSIGGSYFDTLKIDKETGELDVDSLTSTWSKGDYVDTGFINRKAGHFPFVEAHVVPAVERALAAYRYN